MPKFLRTGRAALLFAIAILPVLARANPDAGTNDMDRLLALGDYDAVAATALATGAQPLAGLLTAADAAALHDDPVWRALLHYRRSAFGITRSEVDGADFFLSARGRTDARAELRATLAAFLISRPLPPNNHSAQCRFVARQAWLRERLAITPAQIPIENCQAFDTFREALRAARLTVVFPSAHPNNPSSAFGHTLLRVDQDRPGGSSNLLAWSVTYGAQIENTGPATQAWKGLVGGLEGRFSILPYYVKLREYAQLEDRDVWEYALNVPPERIDFMLRHAWEIVPSRFDYKFFTENCSYHLLTLMDVSMPEAPLADAFPAWVIPVDTLKLMRARGLVADVAWRPAYHTLIRQRRKDLDADEARRALDIARAGADPAVTVAEQSPQRAAAILDLAYDYLRYDRIHDTKRLDPNLSAPERAVLSARSRLGIASDPAPVATPATPPDQGHDSGRFGFGASTVNGTTAALLSYRGAYHEMLDPVGGYAPNSGIEFINLGARYTGRDGLELDRLTLVDILSLEPRDAFFRNISWGLRLGWEGVPREDDSWSTFPTLRGGPGVAYAPLRDTNLLVYGLATAAIDAGREFDDGYRIGAGASAGLLWRPAPALATRIVADFLAGVAGDDGDTARVGVEQNITLARNVALRFNIARFRFLGEDSNEARIELMLFH